MSDLLKNLKGKRDALVTEMRSQLEDAEKRDDGPTAEDDAKLRSYDTDIAALDQRMNDIAATLKRADEIDPDVQAALDAVEAPEKRGDDVTIDAQLRSALQGFKDGTQRSITLKLDQKRALSSTANSGADGGNTIPTDFSSTLVEHLVEMSGVMQAGPNVVRTTSGNKMEIPTTATYSSPALVAESGTIAQSQPTFGQVELDAYKYGNLILVPSELIQDAAFDIAGFVAEQSGRFVGEAFGAHLTTGTGSGQPQGVATAATTGVTGAGAAPTNDELIDLFHSVISPYRMSTSCAWLMADGTVAGIRKIKDSDGQYIWQPGLQAGEPDRLLGKPVRVDFNVAANGTGNKSVLFGDFGRYWVRIVNEVQLATSTDFAFDADQVAFRALMRGDAVLPDTTGAIKAFVGG